MKQVAAIILIGCALWLVAACTEATPPPPPTAAAVVVETGGTALSLSGQGSEMIGDPVVVAPVTELDASGDVGAPADVGAPVADEATPDALAASNQADLVVYQPGATIAARGIVRVYPAADPRAQAMSEYQAATTFVVIEPGADYAGYPVETNEVRWYRVRAEDGLVGWVMADGVEPQDEK